MKNILIGKKKFILTTRIQIGPILTNITEMFVYVFSSKYNLKWCASFSYNKNIQIKGKSHF